jgi:hypothetical protein
MLIVVGLAKGVSVRVFGDSDRLCFARSFETCSMDIMAKHGLEAATSRKARIEILSIVFIKNSRAMVVILLHRGTVEDGRYSTAS